MRFSEFETNLTEGRGVFARTPNDPPFSAVAGNSFGAKEGDPYQFLGVQAFPEQGSFESQEQLENQIAEVEKLLDAQLIWRNPQAKNMSFAVTGFMGPNNNPVYFGKFFKEIQGNMHGKWDNDELPGLRPELAASKKGRVGFKPQDILGEGDQSFANGKALLDAVLDSPGLNEDIKAGLGDFAQGQLPTFPNSEDNFTAIRDNLGEVIQTLALTSGLVAGDADTARKTVLKNADWQSLAIHFPGGKTAGLVDSYLRKGNLSLGISSKGGKGANASIKNIFDALNSAREKGKDLSEEYPEAVEIVNTIATNSMIGGPLKLAIKYNIMTPEQGNEILDLIKSASTNEQDLTPWAQDMISRYPSKTPQGWNYGFWLLANVAKEVGAYVNTNVPEFSKGCLGILNNADMMQVYTNAVLDKQDGSVKITGFKTVYPPSFSGTIQLDPGKGYNSRGATQRIAFSFA